MVLPRVCSGWCKLKSGGRLDCGLSNKLLLLPQDWEHSSLEGFGGGQTGDFSWETIPEWDDSWVERELEVLSIAKVFGIDLTVPKDYDHKSPFIVFELPTEESARNIASRAILIKSIFELWGVAPDYPTLYQNLHSLPESFVSRHLSKTTSFRIIHDSFNKQLALKDKITLIENVMEGSSLPFDGRVDLKNPDQSFHLLEDYGRQDVTRAPDIPKTVYFGRWITGGHRGTIKDFDLKKRKFIGNTSMDAGLAMIMANMGLVDQNLLVFDPFVGTGSLLVASAHFGGHVLGTDIDWKILHGRGRSSRAKQKWRERDENIRCSLRQYGLEHLYVDALVADTSREDMWRPGVVFDAVITDPPYGIREQTKKVGTSKEEVVVADDVKDGHIPSKVTYDLSQILVDLLNFGAKYLRLGGRLVYWLPVCVQDYTDDNVPRHPCLSLVANSEQPLNCRVARRLITMEKTREYQEELQLAVLPQNHYADASFREKYFRPSDKPPANRKYKKRKPRENSPHSTGEGRKEQSCDQSSNQQEPELCDNLDNTSKCSGIPSVDSSKLDTKQSSCKSVENISREPT